MSPNSGIPDYRISGYDDEVTTRRKTSHADLERQLEECKRQLAESSEQQAATAEILRVIASSPTDIQPVLDAVAESAARLCSANDVVIRLVEGDTTRSCPRFQ